ncbi:hypothetical protein E2C01_061057 [Portunus trituberculatus]|uniref:Uncharacterized protein n=1 Tax=Portunus trituberculatus TaxID=210409 RepID=A0A5B7H750_PORTR|nr:hypothetical protein [Portunus trituberculatus]
MEPLVDALELTAPPEVELNSAGIDVSAALSEGCRVIMEAATALTKQQPITEHLWDETHPRWKRLLDSGDNKLIWRAIHWKGGVGGANALQSTEEQFNVHFEELLRQPNVENLVQNIENGPYMPVLDDPFTPNELDVVIRDMSVNKSYSGLCPGIIRSLPVRFCDDSGMVIYEKKTKYFVVNGQENDKLSLVSGGVSVGYASEYLYLGAWFTESGKSDSAVARHETASEAICTRYTPRKSLYRTTNEKHSRDFDYVSQSEKRSREVEPNAA